MSKKPKDLEKHQVPDKKDRQAQFRANVAERGLSPEEAVNEARLVPKDIVIEFKPLRWPR
jgi:hypothetical protein